jgi:hypothetical protein
MLEKVSEPQLDDATVISKALLVAFVSEPDEADRVNPVPVAV